MLLLEPARGDDAEFAYRIFNASGGEVQQCGNGARALARFARPDAGAGEGLLMESPAGPVRARFAADGRVGVDMGRPDFEPASLPFERARRARRYRIELGDDVVEFGAVSMGNPHAVLTVADVATADVARIGPALETHGDFPEGVNVGFMAVESRHHLRLRVWERGAGETLACGTGACAAVAVAREQNLVDAGVTVSLPGGDLVVDFEALGDPIWLTGPAHRTFEGNIDV